MTGSTVTVVLVSLFVLGMAIVVFVAPTLSRRLVQRRALSLPPDLGERMREEWESELDHLGSGVAQLSFALRLSLSSRQALIDAATTSDAIENEGGVVLSTDGLRIAPDKSDLQSATLLDLGVLMVPVIVGLWTHMALLGLLLVMFGWNFLWVLFGQVVSVRLWSATPGMLHAGIQIVTPDRSPLEWRHILSRARGVFIGFVLVSPPLMTAQLALDQIWKHTWFVSCMVCSLLSWWSARRVKRGASRSLATPRSGTLLVMKIPRVVSRLDSGPTRSTSLMR
jgi:hypothetical protein